MESLLCRPTEDAMTTTPGPIPARDSTRRHRSIRLIGVVMLCALLVACGDDTTSSSTATTSASAQSTATGTESPTGGTASPTGSEQLCADIDAFKSSIEDLKNVDIVKSGTSGLQAAVDKVKTSSAGSAYVSGRRGQGRDPGRGGFPQGPRDSYQQRQLGWGSGRGHGSSQGRVLGECARTEPAGHRLQLTRRSEAD